MFIEIESCKKALPFSLFFVVFVEHVHVYIIIFVTYSQAYCVASSSKCYYQLSLKNQV